jgi:hypothetical protein
MAKPKTEMSAELTAALRACVECYGREWRSELEAAWMNGRYHHSLKDHIPALQSRRNTEGVTAWLRSLKKSSFEISTAKLLELLKEGLDYEALDEEGYPYWRKALYAGELPLELRPKKMEAMRPILEETIGSVLVSKICVGTPLFNAFNMRPSDAKRHAQANLLLKTGGDLPLSLITDRQP